MIPQDSTTTLDIVTIIVAGYAAVVATAVGSFTIFDAHRRWRTRVEVKLNVWSTSNVPGFKNGTRVLMFDMVNHSNHPIKITHLALLPQKRRDDVHTMILPQYPTEVPIVIGPRDSTHRLVGLQALIGENIDIRRKIRAVVYTSDGLAFKTKRTQLEITESEIEKAHEDYQVEHLTQSILDDPSCRMGDLHSEIDESVP